MEQALEDERKGRSLSTRASNKEVVKIEFDLTNTMDSEIWKHLQMLLDRVNQDSKLNRVKGSEIIKYSIPFIRESDLARIRDSLLTKSERLQLWTHNYNSQNGLELSTDDFIVDILPGLTKKDLKLIQKVTLQ